MRYSPVAPLLALLLLPVVAGAESREPRPDARDPFLAEVELLITETERAAYLAIERPYQKKEFERRFWEVRDPYPQTPRNELAERWHERHEIARARYGDLEDDRRSMLLLNGEPARQIRLRCPQLLRVGEAWVYSRTDAIPSGFVLVFLTGGVSEAAPHRLWSSRAGLSDAFALSAGAGLRSDATAIERVRQECPRGDELLDLLASASDWSELAAHFPVVPRANPEWVATFLATSTDLPAGAASLAAEVEIRFSGRNQSRTIVDATVVVAAAELSAGPGGATVLDGDVLRGDELFEHFRYRFDLPRAAAPTERIPFAARRFLRPGSYTLVLRLQESSSGRTFRTELPLVVPAHAERSGAEMAATSATSGTAAATPPGASVDAPPAGAAVPAAIAASEPSLRLRAPTDRLVSGRLRVEAVIEGLEPARVDFVLDGKPLFSKRRPPYSIDLDLGRVPRLRRLSAAAFDAAGAPLAEDELVLNGGPHRFAVRILEPERAPAAGERIEARARVDLPEGEELERLEFWLDEERIATLYGPPWAVPLTAPRGLRVSYLRVVGYLEGGVAAEDVRFLAGGDDSLAVDVDFVELYTSALDRRGRPVTGLTEADFRVLEDGVAQPIRRFEVVDDAPIHAGVMIDTSASMVEELDDTEIAAERFVREILTPKDRAAVIPFAEAPRLATRFTNDLELLAGGLADLGAEGETRLYDAVAFALHYFSGVRGKRAIVILSDFADSGSRYRMEEILEYARRTGVAIYGIGLNVPREIPEAGIVLDRMTRETGGRAFRISRAGELGSAYAAIRAELRAQYLIAYQSSRADGSTDYRAIEVEVKRPGVEARTLRGYYP